MIAAAQAIEDGKPVMEAKVVVGREERQTPTFTANMAYLVMSPKWYVPRSIAVKDKLPQLKRNPQALARQNIRIYNSAGQQINPSSVNWKAVGKDNFNYHLRQDAGQLWENYLMVERRNSNRAASRQANAYFWRTYDQKEIDYIEDRDGILHG